VGKRFGKSLKTEIDSFLNPIEELQETTTRGLSKSVIKRNKDSPKNQKKTPE
jgi:hypothetical protein